MDGQIDYKRSQLVCEIHRQEWFFQRHKLETDREWSAFEILTSFTDSESNERHVVLTISPVVIKQLGAIVEGSLVKVENLRLLD